MVQDITIVLLISSFNFLLQKNLPISQMVYQLLHYADNCFLIFENSANLLLPLSMLFIAENVTVYFLEY